MALLQTGAVEAAKYAFLAPVWPASNVPKSGELIAHPFLHTLEFGSLIVAPIQLKSWFAGCHLATVSMILNHLQYQPLHARLR